MSSVRKILQTLLRSDPIGDLPDKAVFALQLFLVIIGIGSIVAFLYYIYYVLIGSDGIFPSFWMIAILIAGGLCIYAGRGARYFVLYLCLIPLFFVSAFFIFGIFSNIILFVASLITGSEVEPGTDSIVEILVVILSLILGLASLGIAAAFISIVGYALQILDRILVTVLSVLIFVFIALSVVFGIISSTIIAYLIGVPVALFALQLGIRYDEQVESFVMATIGSIIMLPIVLHERITSLDDTFDQGVDNVGSDIRNSLLDEGLGAPAAFTSIIEEQFGMVATEVGMSVSVTIGATLLFMIGGASIHYYFYLRNPIGLPRIGEVRVECEDCGEIFEEYKCPECGGDPDIVEGSMRKDSRGLFVEEEHYPDDRWSNEPIVNYISDGEVVKVVLNNPPVTNFGKGLDSGMQKAEYRRWLVGTDRGLHIICGNKDEDEYYHIPHASIRFLTAEMEGKILDPLLNTIRVRFDSARHDGTFEISAPRDSGFIEYLDSNVQDKHKTEKFNEWVNMLEGRSKIIPPWILNRNGRDSSDDELVDKSDSKLEEESDSVTPAQRDYVVPDGAELHHPNSVEGYEAEDYDYLQEFAKDAGIKANKSREELIAELCMWRGFEEGYTERPDNWSELEEYSYRRKQKLAKELGIKANQKSEVLSQEIATELGIDIPKE